MFEFINRRGSNSIKWDIEEEGVTPLWIADMDFKAPDFLMDDIYNRLKTNVFGYTLLNDEWYDAHINWWDKYHNIKLDKSELFYSCGVLSSLIAIINEFSNEGDNILLMEPVYNMFYSTVRENKRNVITSKLIYKDYEFSIDFNDFEEKIKECRLFILCNPQNPTGNVWSREELLKISEICTKYNVMVISDEIHSDIVFNTIHTPYLNICSKNAVMLIAPTKCFNMAGFSSSAVVCKDEDIKKRIALALERYRYSETNALSGLIAVSCLTKGDEWLAKLKVKLCENIKLFNDFINKYIPQFKVIKSNSTFLMWVDISKLNIKSMDLCKLLKEYARVHVSNGESYGSDGFKFIRVNIATSTKILEESLEKIKDVILKIKENI